MPNAQLKNELKRALAKYPRAQFPAMVEHLTRTSAMFKKQSLRNQAYIALKEMEKSRSRAVSLLKNAVVKMPSNQKNMNNINMSIVEQYDKLKQNVDNLKKMPRREPRQGRRQWKASKTNLANVIGAMNLEPRNKEERILLASFLGVNKAHVGNRPLPTNRTAFNAAMRQMGDAAKKTRNQELEALKVAWNISDADIDLALVTRNIPFQDPRARLQEAQRIAKQRRKKLTAALNTLQTKSLTNPDLQRKMTNALALWKRPANMRMYANLLKNRYKGPLDEVESIMTGEVAVSNNGNGNTATSNQRPSGGGGGGGRVQPLVTGRPNGGNDGNVFVDNNGNPIPEDDPRHALLQAFATAMGGTGTEGAGKAGRPNGGQGATPAARPATRRNNDVTYNNAAAYVNRWSAAAGGGGAGGWGASSGALPFAHANALNGVKPLSNTLRNNLNAAAKKSYVDNVNRHVAAAARMLANPKNRNGALVSAPGRVPYVRAALFRAVRRGLWGDDNVCYKFEGDDSWADAFLRETEAGRGRIRESQKTLEMRWPSVGAAGSVELLRKPKHSKGKVWAAQWQKVPMVVRAINRRDESALMAMQEMSIEVACNRMPHFPLLYGAVTDPKSGHYIALFEAFYGSVRQWRKTRPGSGDLVSALVQILLALAYLHGRRRTHGAVSHNNVVYLNTGRGNSQTKRSLYRVGNRDILLATQGKLFALSNFRETGAYANRAAPHCEVLKALNLFYEPSLGSDRFNRALRALAVIVRRDKPDAAMFLHNAQVMAILHALAPEVVKSEPASANAAETVAPQSRYNVLPPDYKPFRGQTACPRGRELSAEALQRAADRLGRKLFDWTNIRR